MKTPSIKVLLACGATAVPFAIGSFAFAQAPASPPASASPSVPNVVQPAGGTSYPNQLSETRGVAQRFTLTPIGEIDGVILADGTEVHLPPHLTTQIASAVKLGDNVVVQGFHSSSVPLVAASSITDVNTGQSVVDAGPPPPGSRPPPISAGGAGAGRAADDRAGKVQMPLYGPAGDINGALLDEGTIVRIGPREAYQIASLLNAGQPLAVQGWVLVTSYGKVVDAQAVGPTAGQMVQVAAPVPAFGPAGPPPR